MDQENTVQDLRTKVAKWCDVRPGEIRLQFCSKELEDAKSLWDYQLGNGSNFVIMSRWLRGVQEDGSS